MRDKKSVILVALGANQPSIVGPPIATLRAAVVSLTERRVRVVDRSRLYRSLAWPDPSDPVFVNAVIRVETVLPPGDLMAMLHDLETRFGRVRDARNEPRTLDLDLIDYDGEISSSPEGLALPHPRADTRPFVLAPLLDVAPDWHHPRLGTSGRDLLQAAETAENRAVPLDEPF